MFNATLEDYFKLAKILCKIEPDDLREIEEMPESDALIALKFFLAPEKKALNLLKVFYSDYKPDAGYATIAENVVLDEKGNLSASLGELPIDPIFAKFMSDPKFRFNEVVYKAVGDTAKRGYRIEISAERYLTKFGAKNLDGYFTYLRKYDITDYKEIERCIDALNLEPDSKEEENLMANPAFFHDFLMRFNELDLVTREITDNRKKEVYKCVINPNKSISQIMMDRGLSAEEIAEKLKDDVKGEIYIGNSEIFYAETIGLRPSQEDAFFIGEAIEPKNTQHTAAIMQEQILGLATKIEKFQKEFGMNGGSTLIVADYSPDQILTIANCGDSKAVVFIKTPDGAVDAFEFTAEHDLEDFVEKTRIEKSGGVIKKGRVRYSDAKGGGLAMTRSLGDTKFQSANGEGLISHESDVYVYDIAKILGAYPQGSRAFLLLSCDGLYESLSGKPGKVVNKDFYAGALRENTVIENPAQYLLERALALDSADNNTVLFTEITNRPNKRLKMAVADGHINAEIAQTVITELSKEMLVNNQAKVVVPENGFSIFSPSSSLGSAKITQNQNNGILVY
ncbi:MAG: PP2C family protein-serine/threonine phosphatase [Pseudomonadota bacterium]